MKKVVFLTPPDASPGFALAGVSHQTAAVAEEAEQVLKKEMDDPDIGAIMVDERLASMIEQDRFQELESRWRGILLVLPSPTIGGEKPEEDYVKRLIRRAIGYHVKVQT